MGLRFAYAATQDIDNYSSNMSKAGDLIKEGLTEIRGIHSNLSSANNTLEQAKTMHSNYISTIKGEIDGIQGVDLNEIALKINLYQSTLTAAYAATAKITQISVLNYI
jgi:flagellin-like hook-associated protein FlgL